MAGIKILVKNRKAFHEYEVGERYEAGISLQGTEVKSIRGGKINLTEGWVKITEDSAWLQQVHISPWSHGNIFNHAEQRPRRLLLKKTELRKLQIQVEQKGAAIIPLKIYLKGPWIKVEIGIGRGKKLHDKRQDSKAKDAQRDMERALKG
ncbi:MAG: SsrA-binding protein SmpB [Oligoflexales bacterium]